MKRLLLSLPLMVALSTGCQSSTPSAQPPAPPDSQPPASTSAPLTLGVQWQAVDNTVSDASFFRSNFTLTNQGPGVLGNSGWKLYFSFVRRILNENEGSSSLRQGLASQGIKISHADAAASGDYYVLEPLDSFVPLAAGESRSLTVLSSDWAILKTDAPAGFHIVFSSSALGTSDAYAVQSGVKIDLTDPKQTTRFSGDVMPVQTPALRFAENPASQTLDLTGRLLPAPRTVTAGTGQVTLRDTVLVGYSASTLQSEATYLATALHDVLNATITPRATTGGEAITLSVNPSLDVTGDGTPDAEGYTLDLTGGKVTITGTDAAGVFYGIQTLRQLIPQDAYAASVQPTARPAQLVLPEAHIADAPGFSYRGMSLDVARHFQTKQTVKKLLDVLASLKINKFHLRIADDEGWRLEIPGIPELTSYGAHRGFDLSEATMLHTAFGDGNDLDSGDHITVKPTRQTTAKPTFQGFSQDTVNFTGKGSGYYTTKDFEEILAYAAERHIDVIPEVDMPGHARAAVKSMEYRYRTLMTSDPTAASQYRLVDPQDTSKHQSVQGYTDNFVNPCLDSTYAFLGKVAQEIKARYAAVPAARLMAIHGGGDELPALGSNVWWQGSTQCKQNAATKDLTDPQLYNYFFTQWNQIITGTGAQMTGWDDIIHEGLELKGFLPMPWSNVWGWGREDDAYKYANQGYKVILSHATNLYMDLAYNKDPDEPGYYWANFVDVKKTFEYRPFDIYANGTTTRMGAAINASDWDSKEHLTDAGKKNILGMHGLLFGENIKSPDILEYMAFPKMLGIAERAWNPELPAVEEMPTLWAHFTNTLGQAALPRLDTYRAVDVRKELPTSTGVNYRIPLPGAQLADGTLSANVLFPGLVVEYSTDGGTTWTKYTAPVAAKGTILLRSRSTDGRTSRVATLN